ncbi:TonB-dependent receptor plug domain-containing protein [Algibacter sp. R77976]|uniref:TonB-dependent receptor plug domain-containing protein n=1 Tax=Algibacter sp. R77976 TaxID=3093873 RepID=UPI0037CA61CD
MKQTLILLVFIFSFSFASTAQIDSIQKLDEVILSDSKLKNYASGVKIEILTDSVIQVNAVSLTNLLAFNSNIYFKENGSGMVSSPSFRGTNASQTAVVWNGININSQLNGQTDFNTINTSNYDGIDIRSGGGSVQYGSGAIGGSIHLNNKLSFTEHFETVLRTGYGSFNSKNLGFKTGFGSKQWTGNVAVTYVDSDNDYKYLGTDSVNENGEFNNLNLNANLGFYLSDKDIIKLYHQSYFGDRNLSGTIAGPSRSKYEDENFRTMLEWSRISGKFSSKIKTVHLHEMFKYFENKDKDNFSLGSVNTFLVNHNFNVRFNDKLQFKTILEYSNTKGKGDSFLEPVRNAFSATTLLNHKLNTIISYGVNLRQDFITGGERPFVFSVDAGFDLFEHYKIQINGSKNYRIPTFNDLYWQPGGNIDLVSESSYQIDFGQQFNYDAFNIKLNGYYINTKDMIQWLPNSTGLWSPINIGEVANYGAELEVKSHYNIGNHYFKFSGHYSYTVSENLETNKQLIYVPFHKGNLNMAYNLKRLSLFYQHIFNGEVFIIGNTLSNYDFGNIGVSYLFNQNREINFKVDFKLNNVYNTYYENVALRPMPNRNFQIQTTIKF